jgi:hypothetical protein
MDLLIEAVNKPGLISEAYRAFYGYSIGNQVLALVQCHLRGIQPGPIATYPGWQKLGRQVRRGEKALTLCMPITFKRSEADEDREGESFTRFVFKAHWFVFSQTEGEQVEMPVIPDWDKTRALSMLDIKETPFEDLNRPGERSR